MLDGTTSATMPVVERPDEIREMRFEPARWNGSSKGDLITLGRHGQSVLFFEAPSLPTGTGRPGGWGIGECRRGLHR